MRIGILGDDKGRKKKRRLEEDLEPEKA